jgi:hypothetical protein
MSGLTAPERETVIVMNDESDVAEVTTHQRPMLTKLRKNPAAEEIEDVSFGSTPGATFRIPKDRISFLGPKRRLSETERLTRNRPSHGRDRPGHGRRRRGVNSLSCNREFQLKTGR